MTKEEISTELVKLGLGDLVELVSKLRLGSVPTNVGRLTMASYIMLAAEDPDVLSALTTALRPPSTGDTLTYRLLGRWINSLTPEQLDCTVTLHDQGVDEFYPIKDTAFTVGDDVLDDDHPYLIKAQ